ncbi:MAG: DUF3499 family protein [Acidimicrobiia bacterium]|nr:DUF3499 family protein [Acidimicrobiia bacterium]
MGLICSRIGCREKAAASLQFDVERSTAVLIDLTHTRNGMPLCERHASSRTAPIGWQLVDRRTGARQMEIWSTEEEDRPAPAFAPPTERPATKRPVDETVAEVSPVQATPSPAVATPTQTTSARGHEPEDAPEPETPSDETGFHWPKHGDEHDEAEDKKEGLAAESPLLSRAFRAAK